MAGVHNVIIYGHHEAYVSEPSVGRNGEFAVDSISDSWIYIDSAFFTELHICLQDDAKLYI